MKLTRIERQLSELAHVAHFAMEAGDDIKDVMNYYEIRACLALLYKLTKDMK